MNPLKCFKHLSMCSEGVSLKKVMFTLMTKKADLIIQAYTVATWMPGIGGLQIWTA